MWLNFLRTITTSIALTTITNATAKAATTTILALFNIINSSVYV